MGQTPAKPEKNKANFYDQSVRFRSLCKRGISVLYMSLKQRLKTKLPPLYERFFSFFLFFILMQITIIFFGG